MKKIIGIGGSLSDFSTSKYALEYALKGAQKTGAVVELIDLGKMIIPMHDTRLEMIPDDVKLLCDAVRSADALIWSTPLYHGSISGLFKNAIDWLQLLAEDEPKYLTNKVVGLICTAGGVQGMQGINSMEYIVRALRGWTFPMVVPVSNAWKTFDMNGVCEDEKVAQQLELLGKSVANASVPVVS